MGKEIIFGIRPEHIHDPQFAPPGITAARVETRVDVTEPMGNEVFLYLVTGEHTFIARVDPRTRARMGDRLEVSFDMSQIHVFDRDTQVAPFADPKSFTKTLPRPKFLGAGFFSPPSIRATDSTEVSMADFDLMRSLAQTAQTKIVLLVMDGLGGLPVEPGGPTELEAADAAESEPPGFRRAAWGR